MTIEGTINYQHLGTGFWGILGKDGQEWKPNNLPEELQKEGLKVKIEAEESEAQMSVFMWGTSIHILKYEVL